MDLTDIVVAAALCGEGGGGGTEQIPADWNQTDPNAKDFIKNKPFDVVEESEVIKFEGTLTYIPDNEAFTLLPPSLDMTISADEVGKEFELIVNDELIGKSTCYTYEDEGMIFREVNYNMSSQEPTDFPAFIILSVSEEEVDYTTISYSDGQEHSLGETVSCKVVLVSSSPSKLPIEKTNVSWSNLPDKPFDVPQIKYVLKDENIPFNDDVGAFREFLSQGIFDDDDVGKTAYIKYNNEVLSAVIVKQHGNYYAVFNFDIYDINSGLIDPEQDGFVIVSYGVMSEAIIFIKDHTGTLTDNITVSFYINSSSKLSGDKIQIDGESIISDNGVLKAVGGSGSSGADWNAEEGEDGYIENKPFGVRLNLPSDIVITNSQTITGEVSEDNPNTIVYATDIAADAFPDLAQYIGHKVSVTNGDSTYLLSITALPIVEGADVLAMYRMHQDTLSGDIVPDSDDVYPRLYIASLPGFAMVHMEDLYEDGVTPETITLTDIKITQTAKDSITLDYFEDEENYFKDENYAFFTSDDIGKTVSLTYNNTKYEGTIDTLAGLNYVAINMDLFSGVATSYPAFSIASSYNPYDGEESAFMYAVLDPQSELPESIVIENIQVIPSSKLDTKMLNLGEGLANRSGTLQLSPEVQIALSSMTTAYASTGLDASDDGTPMETNIKIIGDMFNLEFETHRESIDDVTFTCRDVELDIGSHYLNSGVPVKHYYKDDTLEYSVSAQIHGNKLTCTLHVIKSAVSWDRFTTPMMSSYNW